jgi:hypothetical protein
MASRDWAAEFATAEKAGVDREQAEVNDLITDANKRFDGVVQEAMQMVANGSFEQARSERLATSGAAFLQPQVVEVPVSAQPVDETPLEAPSPVAEPVIVEHVEPELAPIVVQAPVVVETRQDEDIVPALQVVEKQFDRNPKRWADAQLWGAILFLVIGFIIGVGLFNSLGGWITWFTPFWWLIFVGIFTVAGFFVGSYLVWKFYIPRKEVVTT